MRRARINPGRVVSFLPNVITTASLCFGLLSVGLSVQVAAAGVMISPVFVATELGMFPLSGEMAVFYAVAAPVTGFFMVSGVRYRKAGFFSFGGKRFDFLVTTSVLIAVVAINPGLSVAAVSSLYLLSGPALFALGRLRRRGGNRGGETEKAG